MTLTELPLFSRLRFLRPAQTSLARIILATMLTLVVLASVVPLNSLASSPKCRMACCLAKLSHGSDSCRAPFASKDQTESADGQDKESSQPQSIASQAMTAPCSPECVAAASASMQLRRPRDAAAVSSTSKLQTITLVRFKKDSSELIRPSAERRRRIHPRAPPVFLINLSA